MNRREILKYTALATGATICTPLLNAMLTGCTSKTKDALLGITLYFFSQEELGVVIQMIDTIIPKSNSPASSEVGVHHEIDEMVGLVYQEKDREAYRTGFDMLLGHLNKEGFPTLENNEKESMLLDIEQSGTTVNADIKKAYLHLKQQTIAYYLATEEIGKTYLNYLPVPVEYQPCIPVSEVNGKAWAI